VNAPVLFRNRTRTFAVLACVIGCAAIALAVAFHNKASLPYHDSFASNSASEWIPLGGSWEVNNGAVNNRSDERGAKLISGSMAWADYQLDTDLKLIGHEGDVGVIVRIADEERGVDSYRGYYIGLRSADSALVIGRADHGWMEAQPVPMRGGVQIGVWYRLHIIAYGCYIGAEATNIKTKQTSWAAMSDQPCFRRGKIGLRSMATGGSWRNVFVTATDETAWQQIRSHVNLVAQPEFPGREADYNRMRETYFKDTYSPVRSYQNLQNVELGSSTPGLGTSQIVDIDSVRTPTLTDEMVTIRGVVTLTSPLYVQDSSGSIAVGYSKPADLNLGDEVEISGKRVVNGFTPVLAADNIRLLWDRTLVVPVSVTSTQAASGAFDGSLVELRGILESKTQSPEHVITLRLSDSEQTFTAIIHGGLSMQAYDNWAPGSALLIRGICAVPTSSSDTRTAFTILLRAIDDVQVLAGPPWWTGKQLIRLLFLTGLLFCGGVYFYLRLERWKVAAIVGERERLAHEMHDTLAQSFAGIGFHLQGLYNGMRSGNTKHADAVYMLHGACDMVAHSHREASACIAALHPDADQGQDFLVALDRSTREMLFSDNGASLPLKFVREGTPQPLSTQVRDALFHIGREAITNMLRHARATQMEVKLRYEPTEVVLEIRDNGAGFQVGRQSDGFGIRGMQRRCSRIGAQMEILSIPDEGTRVIVRASYGLRPRLAEWVRSLWQGPPRRFFS
jgi:signal transduction histidine kinase